jgi:hypothetical protein
MEDLLGLGKEGIGMISPSLPSSSMLPSFNVDKLLSFLPMFSKVEEGEGGTMKTSDGSHISYQAFLDKMKDGDFSSTVKIMKNFVKVHGASGAHIDRDVVHATLNEVSMYLKSVDCYVHGERVSLLVY